MGTQTSSKNRHYSYIGIQYFALTWTCFDRQTHFSQRDHVDLVRQQFQRASRETNVADIAHCFMPDHVHEIVRGLAADADVARYIRKAKQYSGFYFEKAIGKKLWVRKGFDQLLLDESALRRALQYLLANPVKAGLVDRVIDYPFIGSGIYTTAELMEIAYQTASS